MKGVDSDRYTCAVSPVLIVLLLTSTAVLSGRRGEDMAQPTALASFAGPEPLGSGPNTWTDLTPVVSPPARMYHTMVYDSRADRFVLFGGQGRSGFLNDTWVYDLGNNTWTNVTPIVSPPARAMAAMAYDADADRVVLVGGPSHNVDSNTWTFDLAADRWTAMDPAGYPPIIHGAAMSYDLALHRTLLFGGGDLAPHFWEVGSDATFAYDAAPNAWTNLRASPTPGVLFGHGMVYDPGSGLTYVFGGCAWAPGDLCNRVNGLAAYDPSTNAWTGLSPENSPAPRQDLGMAFVTTWNRILVFGGLRGAGFSPAVSNETVSYDFATNAWYHQAPLVAPSARSASAMAYDSALDRTVMFGGSLSDLCCYPSNDTWVYESGPSSATVPGPPRNLGAAPGAGLIAMGWEPPAYDGGSPVTSYNVYRGTASGSESLFDTVGNVPGYQDWTVAPNVTYYYQVAAVNALGEGPRSNEASASRAALPTSPRTLVASAGVAPVDLAWETPVSNGGSPIEGYRVYRGTAAGGEYPLANVGAVTAYSDAAVTIGVTYFYQVTAINEVGEGPRSTEVSATPSAPPVPPTAPRFLSASAGDGAVTLTWQSPDWDGGSPVTGYRIYRSTVPGGESFLVLVGVVTSYVDAGLANGVSYYYEVSAVNGIGEGAQTPELAAIPSATPANAGSPSWSVWAIASVAVAAALAAGFLFGRLRRRDTR